MKVMMQKTLMIACTAAAAALLNGCSSVQLDESAKQGTLAGDLMRQGGNVGEAALSEHSVYFDFDSYSVKSEYMRVVQAHADNMKANAAEHMVIEGNTDNRGSREYNIALGQKRSEAVKQRMQLLGVSSSRIEAVSFGREKPVAKGDDEKSWAQNRRADITYR